MQVKIIKSGWVDADFDRQLDPESYELWETDEQVWVVTENDLIYQVLIGDRHFVVIAQHWHRHMQDINTLWATELYEFK